MQLPIDYSISLAAHGLAMDNQLGVTGLGTGVAIHTDPEAPDRLPILLGYADTQWCWDRHGQRSPNLAPGPLPGRGPVRRVPL